MDYELQFSQYNEHSILIEWPKIIDENILKSILKSKKSVIEFYSKLKVEVINTYSSILVIYDHAIDNFNDRLFELKSIFDDQNSDVMLESRLWEIPVCYDREFGIDLSTISSEKKLSISEIIELHTAAIYTVYFIGFLPGFLYLGGLHPKLHFNRKNKPSLNIKKGAVAIGGQQTGIYPQDSPGGWHLIGETPIELFNASQQTPCSILAGDRIKFYSVNKNTFLDIKKRAENSTYQLKQIPSNA
ncbi:5-oxoprolinase subunit PxpB [Winogradskyella tangerina]|uniref:5-oxoprolinase subunit PxpB n=1 Tax=Winogradskyella tangerina TaxID=2023240 RepID=UPI000DBE9EF5|nr:5-oxoprolinase subunit PxpB [Winogradskyella tangerina]